MTSQPKSICDVPSILVGHAHDDSAKTGCTVIIPENGAVGGIDIRGSAPGTREIETLKPVRLVPHVHAILLTGGSAFGLDASGGVQQYLEEHGIGFDMGVAKIPIVPSAVIFDLKEGDPQIRPDKKMGYAAAANASKTHPQEGRVGAGRGATVGKVAGHAQSMKGGIGTACERIGDGIYVGALAVVNAFGDVVNQHGDIIAGSRQPDGSFLNSERFLRENPLQAGPAPSNTTLAVVATNAKLTKEDAIKIAQMAQNGLGRSIRPAHTPYDGDLIFCLSVGDEESKVISLGIVAAEVVSNAIMRAVIIANQL